MPRVAKEIDQRVISRLKMMIVDNRYIDDAVESLAAQITNHLFDVSGDGEKSSYPPANASRNSIARRLKEAE